VLFGIVQDRVGDKKTFGITLLLWVASVTLIYATKDLTATVNGALGTSWSVDGVFLVLGGFAGLSIGATQSASRALVGVLAPSTKSGEFFAFWAVSSRVASIFGLVSLGVLQAAFGLHRAILSARSSSSHFLCFRDMEREGRQRQDTKGVWEDV
jgi:UMF1 family MFS transporter